MKSDSSKPNVLPAPLRGIVVPMITPLSDQDTVDAKGLERLIEHILAGGVNALFILGTTGEGPSLSYRLRQEVIERTCEHVAGRVPVLVGITDTAFAGSVSVACKAKDASAQALVLAHPPYFGFRAQDGAGRRRHSRRCGPERQLGQYVLLPQGSDVAEG